MFVSFVHTNYRHSCEFHQLPCKLLFLNYVRPRHLNSYSTFYEICLIGFFLYNSFCTSFSFVYFLFSYFFFPFGMGSVEWVVREGGVPN